MNWAISLQAPMAPENIQKYQSFWAESLRPTASSVGLSWGLWGVGRPPCPHPLNVRSLPLLHDKHRCPHMQPSVPGGRISPGENRCFTVVNSGFGLGLAFSSRPHPRPGSQAKIWTKHRPTFPEQVPDEAAQGVARQSLGSPLPPPGSLSSPDPEGSHVLFRDPADRQWGWGAGEQVASDRLQLGSCSLSRCCPCHEFCKLVEAAALPAWLAPPPLFPRAEWFPVAMASESLGGRVGGYLKGHRALLLQLRAGSLRSRSCGTGPSYRPCRASFLGQLATLGPHHRSGGGGGTCITWPLPVSLCPLFSEEHQP